MAAVVPRSKSSKNAPKLSRSSEETCKKRKQQMGSSSSLRHSLSGKSRNELAATGGHPWAGVADALLKPLPPDWRYNIQQAVSAAGDALGNALQQLLGAHQGQRVAGRRF